MNPIHETARFRRLDLNLFRVFLMIFQERNLTRAAERLSLSQSAVSHALARLRSELDDPLFKRDGLGVAPTPFAQRIWPDISEALGLLRVTVHRSHGFDAARDLKSVTIAMSEEVEPVVFPPVFRAIESVAPNTDVRSVRLNRTELRAGLATGKIDCAIDIVRVPEDDLRHAFVAQDDFVVIARGRTPIDAETYLAARHITVSSRPHGRGVEDIELARHSLHRKIAVRCQSYGAASRLVADTDLLLTMPRLLANIEAESVGASILSLPLKIKGPELHVYWHRDREEEHTCTWIRETIQNSLKISC